MYDEPLALDVGEVDNAGGLGLGLDHEGGGSDSNGGDVVFPRCISESLSLRLSMLDYSDGVPPLGDDITTSGDPETWYCSLDNTCLMPRRFAPVGSYPLLIDERVVSLRPTWCRANTCPLNVLGNIERSGLRWVQRSYEIADHDLGTLEYKISSLYADPPLHVFNSSSVSELASLNRRELSPWKALFDDMLGNPRKLGLYGTILNNSCVDMRPYEASADYSCVTDPTRRRYRESWKGFVDPSYTVASSDAGRIWSLVHRVRVRVCNDKVISHAREVLSALLGHHANCDGDSSDTPWDAYFCGVLFRTSRSNVLSASKAWGSTKGHQAPSLHIFEDARLVTLSVSSGCLIRPVSVTDNLSCDNAREEHWVDSTVFNSNSMRCWLGLARDLPSDVMEYCNTYQLLSPYVLWDKSPRPALGFNMSSQAVCLPEVTIISTVKSVSTSKPVVRTPLMELVCNSMAPDCNWSLPGANVVVLFANLIDTYEDSVVVNARLNKSGVFATKATLNHPLHHSSGNAEVGSTISSSSHAWWRSGDDGMVVRGGYNKSKERYVVASLSADGLRPGDKVATQHGQKQTVSRVVEDNLMPICTDTRTGRSFTPDVVMAASSVHNRCTPGQIFEAWSGGRAVYEKGASVDGEGAHVVTSAGGSEARGATPYECNFTTLGSGDKVVSGLGGRGLCVADYGIIRLWQLAHMSRDKQHFASSVPRGTRGPRGKLFGSSVRIGESELAAMLSKGWVSSVAESLDSSDMALVAVCSICRRLSMLCDCRGNQPPTTLVLTRSSLAKLDICRAVYTINANAGTASERSVRCNPESFKYHT